MRTLTSHLVRFFVVNYISNFSLFSSHSGRKPKPNAKPGKVEEIPPPNSGGFHVSSAFWFRFVSESESAQNVEETGGADGVVCLVVEFTNLINPCSGLMKLPGAHYLQRLGGWSEKLFLSFSHGNCWG